MHSDFFHSGKEELCFEKEAFRKLQLPYFSSINVPVKHPQAKRKTAVLDFSPDSYHCKLLQHVEGRALCCTWSLR